MPDRPPAPPCFVTGARGLVGRAVVRTLAARGQPMRLGLRTPWDGPLPPRCEAVAHRLDAQDADATALLRGCASVLHLAARAHVLHDAAPDPQAAYRAVNLHGTLRLAEQAAAAGVQRFVFVSTVKIHGESTAPGQPFTEAAPAAPQDAYARSKCEAEQGLAAIAARTGMALVVVRPPLVYGPGVRANFATLLRAVARGWPLPLAGLDNRRSLLGVDNLADLLALCLHHPAAVGQSFLASDGEDLSTPQLLRRIGAALGGRARLVAVPPTMLRWAGALTGHAAAVQRLCSNLQVDSSKARALLGWTPPVSVDEGLRRAVQGMAR